MRLSPVILPPDVDWPHVPEADEWWQESVVLTWADPVAELGGCIRLGHQPPRGLAKCCFGVVSRDGPGYTRSAQDLPLRPEDRGRSSFTVDGFCTASFQGRTSAWSARDADCELELQVEDVHDVYDFFSLTSRSEVSRNMMAHHIQAGGAFTGRVRLGGVERDLSGFTYRDHSWGVRRLHRPAADFYAAWWLGGALGPDFAFGFGDGRSQSGDSMPFGYIVKDGQAYAVSVDDAWIGVSMRDGISGRCARVRVSCPELGVMTFEVDGYANVVLELETKHFELSMPCTIRCGERIGAGSVELIFNPRNGADRPFWLEGAALENGPCRFEGGKLVQAPFGRPTASLAAPGGRQMEPS